MTEGTQYRNTFVNLIIRPFVNPASHRTRFQKPRFLVPPLSIAAFAFFSVQHQQQQQPVSLTSHLYARELFFISPSFRTKGIEVHLPRKDLCPAA
jgi:hypothetical protein